MLTQSIIDKSPRLKAIFADPKYAHVLKKAGSEAQSLKDLEVKRQQEAAREERNKITSQLWAELHLKADPSEEWFRSWVDRVPSFGCKCRSDFETITKANCPRFDDWFAWSVEVHNAVNRKLNRKEWTVEEAKARWTADFTE